ncbi:hypothetical protein K1719_003819 [Acacia pycnantha]|nr:hypothetical protein K1719_003819 [Acacia pycnantha]
MKFDSDVLKPCKTMLTGFNGQDTRPKGYVDLKLTLGNRHPFKTERVRFIVADFPSSYNIILGRRTIHNWDMLVSSKHQKLKMVSKKNKVVTIRGDQKESRQCYFNTVKKDTTRPVHPEALSGGKAVNLVELDLRKEEKMKKAEPNGELEDFLLGSEPGQITKIGKALGPGMREELEVFLRDNRDVFAWRPSEIPGIDPDFCCHQLAIRPGSTPSHVSENDEPSFEDQIGRNVEVYIDDMIVKSVSEVNHIDDLRQTFDKLRKYRIRLNPAKCAFGVPAGKFLGFLLTNRGIEVNPDKCQAVLDMKAPRSKKEVQRIDLDV